MLRGATYFTQFSDEIFLELHSSFSFPVSDSKIGKCWVEFFVKSVIIVDTSDRLKKIDLTIHKIWHKKNNCVQFVINSKRPQEITTHWLLYNHPLFTYI